jgi:uracil-DNA glycosylase
LKLFDLLPKQWQEALPRSKEILDGIQISKPYIPEESKIFAAFELPIDQIRVCIIGQDPYPNPEHAMGISFSVPNSITKLPPTLKNILKELESDIGFKTESGNLSKWQKSGVMLLNRVLTTEPNVSAGHTSFGWQSFTDAVVQFLGERDVVFILWGNSAAELRKYIAESNLIMSVHPSPLSAYRGFFGSQPFSRCNEKLRQKGISEIDWKI